MKYKCVKAFWTVKYDSEEFNSKPIGRMAINKDSVWIRRDCSGDFEIMLDNENEAEWLGMSQSELKDYFVLVNI